MARFLYYYPEPRGLNSSALISQLRFMTEEKEASTAREVLCDPSGRRWVPNKQGQPYYHVCIYLHEDELFSSSYGSMWLASAYNQSSCP